ncbi:hypothetical protein J6E39_08060 [bacterium]|nr:hypothetical protein [bacterium]
MVNLKVITSFLEQGGRYRMKFSGKQLEALPEHLKPLIKDIKDPVVHIGINGRGAEGSMYGAKVFAKGSKEPVAAVAGRVDYREADPILQARGFVRKNSGEGDALRANLMLDTGKPFNIEAMDELAMHKAKDVYRVQARSNFANADIKIDRPAAEEIAGHMGIKIPTIEKLQKLLENVRTGIKAGFNAGNPYNVEKAAAKVGEFSKVTPETKKVYKVAGSTKDDIRAYLKATKADRNAKAIADAKKHLADVEKRIAELENEFKTCKYDDTKSKIAEKYEHELETLRKIESEIKYLES